MLHHDNIRATEVTVQQKRRGFALSFLYLLMEISGLSRSDGLQKKEKWFIIRESSALCMLRCYLSGWKTSHSSQPI